MIGKPLQKLYALVRTAAPTAPTTGPQIDIVGSCSSNTPQLCGQTNNVYYFTACEKTGNACAQNNQLPSGVATYYGPDESSGVLSGLRDFYQRVSGGINTCLLAQGVDYMAVPKYLELSPLPVEGASGIVQFFLTNVKDSALSCFNNAGVLPAITSSDDESALQKYSTYILVGGIAAGASLTFCVGYYYIKKYCCAPTEQQSFKKYSLELHDVPEEDPNASDSDGSTRSDSTTYSDPGIVEVPDSSRPFPHKLLNSYRTSAAERKEQERKEPEPPRSTPWRKWSSRRTTSETTVERGTLSNITTSETTVERGNLSNITEPLRTAGIPTAFTQAARQSAPIEGPPSTYIESLKKYISRAPPPPPPFQPIGHEPHVSTTVQARAPVKAKRGTYWPFSSSKTEKHDAAQLLSNMSSSSESEDYN